jgi:hypothetical protein
MQADTDLDTNSDSNSEPDPDTYGAWYCDCHNQLHRDGGLPAFIKDSYRAWWQHGKRHRENDLPAVVNHHFLNWREWWVDGVRQTRADRVRTRSQLARWSPLRATFVGAVAVSYSGCTPLFTT